MRSRTIKNALIGIGVSIYAGCRSTHSTGEVSELRSEREYAVRTEAVAQELVKSGQAENIGDARLQAALQSNKEWAAAEKKRERKAKQEKFETDLSRMQRSK